MSDAHVVGARLVWLALTERILRIDDGGRSGMPQPTASGIDRHTVFMLDAQRAWIGGRRGAVLATSTGGR